MENESGWKRWFPLTKYITSEIRTFWIAVAAYLVIPVLVGILFLVAANTKPVLALIIGLLEMPILFYAIVAVLLALGAYRKAAGPTRGGQKRTAKEKKEKAEKKEKTGKDGE
ncbi:MAG: hypothetical protein IJU20_05620 [Clostridia bacterium]|nr:hypothetical protein [Clostridia bacterium]